MCDATNKGQYKKNYILKNGIQSIVRTSIEDDAEELIDQLKLLNAETRFLLREPEEITFSIEQEREFIRTANSDENRLFLVTEIEGKIVANCMIGRITSNFRHRHRASMGISVNKEYWGLGIGNLLLEECVNWVKNMGFEQIELDVVTENERAISLYKKFGFEIFGTQKRALKYKDGEYGDLYLMMLDLRV